MGPRTTVSWVHPTRQRPYQVHALQLAVWDMCSHGIRQPEWHPALSVVAGYNTKHTGVRPQQVKGERHDVSS